MKAKSCCVNMYTIMDTPPTIISAIYSAEVVMNDGIGGILGSIPKIAFNAPIMALRMNCTITLYLPHLLPHDICGTGRI